jgi:hypothetical protein
MTAHFLNAASEFERMGVDDVDGVINRALRKK